MLEPVAPSFALAERGLPPTLDALLGEYREIAAARLAEVARGIRRRQCSLIATACLCSSATAW